MIYILVLLFLENYQKVNLGEELKQLSKIGGGEAKNRKGMNLLYELTKSTNVDCPNKVDRLHLMNYYESEVE